MVHDTYSDLVLDKLGTTLGLACSFRSGAAIIFKYL
jgi:hypothetical protein